MGVKTPPRPTRSRLGSHVSSLYRSCHSSPRSTHPIASKSTVPPPLQTEPNRRLYSSTARPPPPRSHRRSPRPEATRTDNDIQHRAPRSPPLCFADLARKNYSKI